MFYMFSIVAKLFGNNLKNASYNVFAFISIKLI